KALAERNQPLSNLKWAQSSELTHQGGHIRLGIRALQLEYAKIGQFNQLQQGVIEMLRHTNIQHLVVVQAHQQWIKGGGQILHHQQQIQLSITASRFGQRQQAFEESLQIADVIFDKGGQALAVVAHAFQRWLKKRLQYRFRGCTVIRSRLH